FERRRAGGRVLVRDELALRLDGRPGSLRCGLGDLPDGLLRGGRRGLRGRSRALRERDRRSRVRGRVLRLSILSVGAVAKREPEPRGAGVRAARGRGWLLRRDDVGRLALPAAGHVPAEARVLEEALREGKRLAAPVGDNEGRGGGDNGRRRLRRGGQLL